MCWRVWRARTAEERAVAGQRTRRDGREEISGDDPKMRVSIDGDAATTGDVEVAVLTRR
jgi:hypothetical protein